MILVIPAAGEGSRFKAQGFITPKPVLPLRDTRPMITSVIEDCIRTFGKFERIIIPTRADMVPAIDAATKQFPVQIVGLSSKKPTRGAAETVMLALNIAMGGVELEGPVVVANSDQRFSARLPASFDRESDAVLTFKNDGNSKWSYLKPSGVVVEKPEVVHLDWKPTCGIYYFPDLFDLQRRIANQIAFDIRHGPNAEFYLAPILHRPQNIPVSEFHGLGTPEDYLKYMGV